MSHIKIKSLIFAALGMLLSLMVVLAAFGLYGIGHTEQQFKDVTLREARTQQMMVRIRLLMESNRSQILQALQHNPEFEWSKLHDHALEIHFATIKDNLDKLNESWKAYADGIVAADEKALADAWFDKSGHLGQTSIEDAANAIRKGDWNGAESVLITKINPTYRVGLAASDELKSHLAQRAVANDAGVAARIAAVRYSLIGALLSAMVVAVLVGAVLVKNITRPLGEAVRIARRVADGDLSTPIRVTSTNELGVLLQALSDMNSSLSRVVGAVRTSADCIAAGAGEIAGGNIDLSRRTEAQASSLQRTASSMEELSTTVESNADSARQAAAVAGAASEVAVQGGTVFGQVVTTMTDIATSSRKISDIITVIDGIAFQTNILALNAAVEAARAGEQGRGFAVVASEVRSLAQRSAGAAKEIAGLIHASVEKVESGTRHVNSAGNTMTDLVGQVKRVSALIGEISNATTEQTSGINEVGRAVHQLDQTTQQNAALVEHSAAAAQTLRDEAVQLVNAVALFKLKTA